MPRNRPASALPSPTIRRRVALIAALLCCAAASASAATQTPKLTLGPTVGVQFHCTWNNYSDGARKAVVVKMASAGVKAVRIDFSWASFQEHGRHRISPWAVRLADRCVNLARAKGLEVLGTILWTPSWANGSRGLTTPPTRLSDFTWFAHWAAKHFRGRVGAWEVWNEPDTQEFWRGTPRRYVRMLRGAYPALKRGDPSAAVVFGGLVHNDERWLANAYAAGAQGSFDVMATHPYQGDFPPELTGDSNDVWLLTHVPAVHDVMARHGDGAKPIWFTEFGWSTHANTPTMAAWQRGVSPEVQAQYLVRTITLVRTKYPYVQRVFWYKERALRGDDAHTAGFGLLKTDLSPRPVYTALKALLLG